MGNAILSWGTIRRFLHPLFLHYWSYRKNRTVKTRLDGFDLLVLPSVFHPKYFGSSPVLARFIVKLPLKGKTFLDLGCGSGIIGLYAARAGAKVMAADINPAAVESTLRNAATARLQIETRVSDLFSDISESFDVIAWNPPYLPGIARDSAETAFFAGANYDVVRRFTSQAAAHLNPGGKVYTILSSDANIQAIQQLFRDNRFSTEVIRTERGILGERLFIQCSGW